MKTQNIHRLVLDNGITLLLTENPTTDLIAARLFFKNAGLRWESSEKAGLSNLFATVLTKGSQQYSSVDIAEKVESIGASLGADSSSDYFIISLKTISKDFPEILELTEELIKFPTFPETEIELEKNLICQSIRSQMEQPFNVAFNQLRQMMYGSHPYGISPLGTPESVRMINREDLQNYQQKIFRPESLVVSISGNINREEGIALINKIFGNWQNLADSFIAPNNLSINSQPGQKNTAQASQQAIIMIGYLTPGIKHEDYAALKLLSTYLGNGLSSRLFVELREKRGLAYDVSAFYPSRLDTSQFVTYIGTAPQNTEIALEGLHAEAQRLQEQELSPQELEAAKNKLLGQYALGKQTNGEIAQIYGWYETLGLGVEFDAQFQEAIAYLSAEKLRAVAKQYLQAPYISVVGPAEALDELN
jgi:predicted Zn-dependent peptidase